jgi:hypothetical protein
VTTSDPLGHLGDFAARDLSWFNTDESSGGQISDAKCGKSDDQWPQRPRTQVVAQTPGGSGAPGQLLINRWQPGFLNFEILAFLNLKFQVAFSESADLG